MSNKASTNTTVTILPDNIKTKLRGLLSYDITSSLTSTTGDGWFYAEKNLTGTSGQLIESTEDYLGSATGAGSIASGDKVRWIVIKHTGTSNGTTSSAQSIVLTIDGSAAAYTSSSGIFLQPGEIIAFKPSSLEASNLNGVVVNVISGIPSSSTTSAHKVRVIVAGIVNNIA